MDGVAQFGGGAAGAFAVFIAVCQLLGRLGMAAMMCGMIIRRFIGEGHERLHGLGTGLVVLGLLFAALMAVGALSQTLVTSVSNGVSASTAAVVVPTQVPVQFH